MKRQFEETYISSDTARSLRQALERKSKIGSELRVDWRKRNKTVIEKERTIRRLKKGLGLTTLSHTPRKTCSANTSPN